MCRFKASVGNFGININKFFLSYLEKNAIIPGAELDTKIHRENSDRTGPPPAQAPAKFMSFYNTKSILFR